MTQNNQQNFGLVSGSVDANTIKLLSGSATSMYDYRTTNLYDVSLNQGNPVGINEITGKDMLEVFQKGLYKSLVSRRDDAKALWEEEDDDASYGEYTALKEVVELLEKFLREAPSRLYQPDDRYRGRDTFDNYYRY